MPFARDHESSHLPHPGTSAPRLWLGLRLYLGEVRCGQWRINHSANCAMVWAPSPARAPWSARILVAIYCFHSKLFWQLCSWAIQSNLPKWILLKWITHLNGKNLLDALFTFMVIWSIFLSACYLGPRPTGFGMGHPTSLVQPYRCPWA